MFSFLHIQIFVCNAKHLSICNSPFKISWLLRTTKSRQGLCKSENALLTTSVWHILLCNMHLYSFHAVPTVCIHFSSCIFMLLMSHIVLMQNLLNKMDILRAPVHDYYKDPSAAASSLFSSSRLVDNAKVNNACMCNKAFLKISVNISSVCCLLD